MNEENNNKKKTWLYYIVLAAGVLIIAASTVAIIFAVGTVENVTDNIADNNSTNDQIIDSSATISGDDNASAGDDEQPAISDDLNSGNAEQPTVTTVNYALPVEGASLLNGYNFYKNNTLDCYHFHSGLDFEAAEGTPVYACLDGVIDSITYGDYLDGGVITICHDDGLISTYKFINYDENLQVGDAVSKGQQIGTIAQAIGSEYKDGAHLHFELSQNGALCDPEDYLDIQLK
jgi:murein DD-endopeptidase MepM/ murein hydrolase activator NlpD